MNIYISGINGTGMGPLALMAADAGFHVRGSDCYEGAISAELQARDIDVAIGPQDGSHLEQLLRKHAVDWFVYTSALPADHPELLKAKAYGVKVSKRDELIAFLLKELQLKMVAIAGTHGKTTTTSMIIWTCLQLGIPISYLVGTTLPFSAAGSYQPDAQFFIYEADEYDRNFLHFHPWLSIITSISYDHPDIYPTEIDYQTAFVQFAHQSQHVITDAKLPNFANTVITSQHSANISNQLALAGSVRRYDAVLAALAIKQMAPELSEQAIATTLNDFPGVGRRFERIAPGVYSDYAHHPEEVQAAVETALEEAKRLNLKGVIAIYQPHQNTRQHSVRQGYRTVFTGVQKLYWLPTYLTREDPDLPILTPQELIDGLIDPKLGMPAEMDEFLAEKLKTAQKDGFLILLMTAGPADTWFRKIFNR